VSEPVKSVFGEAKSDLGEVKSDIGEAKKEGEDKMCGKPDSLCGKPDSRQDDVVAHRPVVQARRWYGSADRAAWRQVSPVFATPRRWPLSSRSK
jgi:hypothetical protein